MLNEAHVNKADTSWQLQSLTIVISRQEGHRCRQHVCQAKIPFDLKSKASIRRDFSKILWQRVV